MSPAMPIAFDLALEGPGGEPVDLWRTLRSHGLTALPPMALDHVASTLEITIPVGVSRRPATRTVLVAPASPGLARVTLVGPRVRAGEPDRVRAQVIRVLRLDEDLSSFYAMVATDPDLAWAAVGAGRMVRSPTVFEDVVKTLCTTNCSWGATRRMIGALVGHLGHAAPGAPPAGQAGRAFPTPEAMAGANEQFYRDVVRAGYRGRYLATLATAVAEGTLDLEALGDDRLDDDEVDHRLQALPGVGPYAACHVMVLLGRYSRLVLDSWTRPKYARLVGRPWVADEAIIGRFSRYGQWAGLAFWLFLTADWVEST
ncbi:MAG: Fe-S cluster assembly protein HesB [Actinomycetota bacterium]|nr:Fe-S cluster assembly protein HesB [Actinomycetota bacterium]